MMLFENDITAKLNTILTALYGVGVKTEIEHDGKTRILIIETVCSKITADITYYYNLGMINLPEVLMLILVNFGDGHINEFDGILLDNEGVL